jgi:D-arabinose 1-dehydrogenase-like Zn-dependent alcohol dehydrogenase
MVIKAYGTHAADKPLEPMTIERRTIAGSLIGGLAETQEMLDFCAERGIVSDVELIPIQQIEQAFERMAKGDVKYRFVIEMDPESETGGYTRVLLL